MCVEFNNLCFFKLLLIEILLIRILQKNNITHEGNIYLLGEVINNFCVRRRSSLIFR